MIQPEATIIISVYKNTRALKAVLDSLNAQTFRQFEIIISEDGASKEMEIFIGNYTFGFPYFHLTQPDEGWRKNEALNKAILASTSNRLIFIDGDCVLHPEFVQMHVKNAGDNIVLAGKRTKLNEELSNMILEGGISVQQLSKIMLSDIFLPKKQTEFPEEGFFLANHALLKFIPSLRKVKTLMGSNMSFSKKAITHINGFDEDYNLPAAGEDADLYWRFRSAGFQIKSVRNLAVQFHLYHPLNWTDQKINLEMMHLKMNQNEYICRNGLIKR